MADIKAFNGYMYNSEKIEDLGLVMSPPYDSLMPEEQDELYSRHEYNAIRLTKGKKFDTDSDTDNSAVRANKYLTEWIESNVLIKDAVPAIYLYEQEVFFNNTTYSSKGLVALLKLEDFGNHVHACEDVTPVNKKDRFELIARTKANFNMINSLYIESEKPLSRLMTEISDTPADVSFVLPDGSKERLWRIIDPEKIDFIVKSLKPHTLYITDGQNRYETALRYQAECIKNNPNHTGDEPYNYIMTLLTNAYDDSIVHIPFHRLVKFEKAFNESFFVACCQDNFKIEKIIVDTDTSEFVDTIKKQIVTSRNENKIALYCGGDYFYRLTLKNSSAIKELLPEKSDAYLSLDVTVLNKLILEDILNISQEEADSRIEYTKSVTQGLDLVKEGTFGCLLAINPVRTEQIRSVATSGDKMPPHSICVFPKPITGILFNIL